MKLITGYHNRKLCFVVILMLDTFHKTDKSSCSYGEFLGKLLLSYTSSRYGAKRALLLVLSW